MAQILPQQGSFGETLGRGLGTGIGSALQNLASLKLNQLQQQHERNQYARFLEENKYSPEQARLIASFPADQRLAALQSLQLPQAQPQVPAAVENQGLSSVLEQMETKAKPLSGLELLRLGQQQQLQQTPLGQKLSQEQSPFDLNVLANEQAQKMLNLSPEHQNRLQERIQEISKDVNKQNKLKEELNKFLQASPEEQQKQLQQLQQQFLPSKKVQQKQLTFEKPLTEAQRLSIEEKRIAREEKKAETTEKESKKEQARINKETQPYYKEISDAARASFQADNRLNRMEEIIKKGKLPWPGPRAFVNAVFRPFLGKDFDLSELGNPDAAEFKKLQNDFLRDAKSIFGSRLTNFDVESFLKIVPNLSTTSEGNLRIIHELRLVNEAARIKKQTMDSIIKENGGKRPENLDSLVEQKAKPELDRIAIQFKEGLPTGVSFLGF